MSRRKRRTRRAGRSRVHHQHPERLAIASVRVLDGVEPLRLVMRYADGGWAFLCNTTADADHLVAVHSHHLFDEFPRDLAPLRPLPRGHVAVRDDPGHPWRIEPFVEEEEE